MGVVWESFDNGSNLKIGSSLEVILEEEYSGSNQRMGLVWE